ncbi:hypothetical protein [Curtobacterium sp. PhB115]|uniref:hypothetical protein n=1 Tax=Curtobacterium sp. PhB115 TaxID=2485173 RepID=UPI0011CDFDBE|nr:hypothetical protein [Curtobacterium sp. PhB115]
MTTLRATPALTFDRGGTSSFSRSTCDDWDLLPVAIRALVLARASAAALELTRFDDGDTHAAAIAGVFAMTFARAPDAIRDAPATVHVTADTVVIDGAAPLGRVHLDVDNDFPPVAAAAHLAAAILAGNTVTFNIPTAAPPPVLTYLGFLSAMLPDHVLTVTLVVPGQRTVDGYSTLIHLAVPGGCPQLVPCNAALALYQQQTHTRVPFATSGNQRWGSSTDNGRGG